MRDTDSPVLAGIRGLPVELTSFVGRREELREIRQLLSEARLVTLTGPGGVGKTRLALRAASELARSFPDGVWLIELAEVSDTVGVEQSIVPAMGTPDVPDVSNAPDDRLVAHLADREILVVLDNCEHVVATVALLADRVLRYCPGVRILATSREALMIHGERRLEVRPLEVPCEVRPSATHGEAVSLFADRAAAAVPGFELTAANRTAVGRIVTRLDGLPLAIELAVARLRAMSAAELAERLSDPYQLLTRAPRLTPDRHQTLRRCVEWSYEQCTGTEKLLWARLSVFASGFEIDAVEDVVGFGQLPATEVYDVLDALVRKSVVTRVGGRDRARFQLLETMREYGWERLAQRGEVDEVIKRHRSWYASLVRRAFAATIGPDQAEWWCRLDREQANLTAAMEATALQAADASATAVELGDLVGALLSYWHSRGMLEVGRHWIDRAISALGPPPTSQSVQLCADGASMAVLHGAHAAAAQLVERALREAAGLSDEGCLSSLEFGRGLAASMHGDAALAATEMTASADGYLARNELVRGCRALVAAVDALGHAGRVEEARILHDRGITLLAPLGERFYRGRLHGSLARTVLSQGDVREARALLMHGLRLQAGIADRPGITWSLHTLALCESAAGSHERATVCAAASDRLRRELELSDTFEAVATLDREAADRAGLGQRVFEEARKRGCVMDLDSMVAYALGEGSAPGADAVTTAAQPTAAALTPRESDVAGLVAEGLTNRQIAARLFITQRTVRGHLENIMIKLGATSRARVASWFVGSRTPQASLMARPIFVYVA